MTVDLLSGIPSFYVIKDMNVNNNNSKSMTKSKLGKNDEFYTAYEDIAKEISFYGDYFKGKTVYCNCDNPYESNFVRFFATENLGIHKLIATNYAPKKPKLKQRSLFGKEEPLDELYTRTPYLTIIGEGILYDENKESFAEFISRYTTIQLDSDGDFKSRNSVAFLEQSDVVVTNPPFSLFRDFVDLVISKGKDFLVLGNMNAVTYKDFFPYFKEDKVWFGASIHSGDREFRVPDSYPLNATGCRVGDDGYKYIRVKGIRWFTNIGYVDRYAEIPLSKHYDKESYPCYDGYDAIEVSKSSDIPCDYDGVMGVPITFLDKYSPNQFEILGLDRYTVPKEALVGGRVAIEGKPCYARIMIRRRS